MVRNISDVSNSKIKNVTDIDAEVKYINPRSRVKIAHGMYEHYITKEKFIM